MDSLKRESLRMQTVSLTDNMNPGLLGPYLYSKKLLTHDEFERLQLPTMTTRDRNLFILQVSMIILKIRRVKGELGY